MSEQSRRKQGGFFHTLVRARNGKAGRQNQIHGSLPTVNAARRAETQQSRDDRAAVPRILPQHDRAVLRRVLRRIGRHAALDGGGTYYVPANMTYREWEKAFVEGGDKKGLRELFRRKTGKDGQEIIDKTTYNKLTKDFLKRGGIIIRGEEAEKHLKDVKAYASYMAGANVAFIRDDATISDVLEEMYHAEQDRKHMFGEAVDERIIYLREIDAQKYLLDMAEKYKIPLAEQNATREVLEYYERKLSELDGE